MGKSNRKTMIIVWSWKSGGLGEGDWRVAGSRHAGDQVLCRDWPAKVVPLQELIDLASNHRQGGDVMVFLHRQHGYHQEHIEKLSEAATDEQGSVRSYLFGEGSNAIYLTRDPRGLLGTSGTFSAQVCYDEQPSTYINAIADEDRRELNPSHFSYVWDRYQHALRARIFELREDVLHELAALLPRTALEAGEGYEFLSRAEHRAVLLRLLSFSGRIRAGSDLAQELRQVERLAGRAFSFDDCGVQMEQAYGPKVAEVYHELAGFIRKKLLAKSTAVDMQELRQLFDELLRQIPGAVYN